MLASTICSSLSCAADSTIPIFTACSPLIFAAFNRISRRACLTNLMKMEGGRNVEISERGRNENDNRAYWDLHEAAAKGDWGKAEEIFKGNPEYVEDEHSDVRDTALQAAVLAGHSDFVQKLLRSSYMKKEDLERKKGAGDTALFLAVTLGNIEVVLMMLEKNKDLVNIRNGRERLPVQIAASLRHEDMVKILYNPKKDDLNDEDRILLLVTLIDNDIYDVALSMVEKFPRLAVSRENGNGNEKMDANGQKTVEIGETALHALARKPLMTFGNSKQGFISSNMVEKKKMNPKALELLELLWEKMVKQLNYNQISDLITTPSRLTFDAAKQGNIELISFLISKQPNAILNVDENGYTLFHTAVEYRQEKIFKLISKNPSIKNAIVKLKVGEEEKTTILHLAAKLPPDLNRLKVVSGAALQMQRELWWFKEVRKLMPPSNVGAKNGEGKTAQTLFTESHRKLMKEGEEWMKTTANSCMIVATLIATIVFAAAFTVPGGVKDDTGDPHFLRKASFICFAIFDIISLVSSSFSILIFLSILTARYAEEDFLLSLPRKLFQGLSTLCMSIETMMAVFCTTLFIVFDEGTKVPALLAIALAFILVFIFILLQIRLILDVYFSLIAYNNDNGPLAKIAKYAFNTF